MNPRYTALPLIASVLKLLAAIVLIIGILGAAWTLIFGGPWPGFWSGHVRAAGIQFINATIRGFSLWAIAEFIHVALDIEENPRRAADSVAKAGTIDIAPAK